MTCRILACTLLACLALSTWGDDTVVKGLFRSTATGLSFTGDDWQLASSGARGWTSLRLHGGEYWQAGDTRGACAIKQGSKWITAFPDRSTLSHDEWAGRHGSVADGVYLVKLSPDWHRPVCELYLGANVKEDFQVCFFLSDEVTAVRLGVDGNRPWLQGQRDHASQAQGLAKTRAALVLHRNGTALAVTSTTATKGPKGEDQPPPEFQVGVTADPAGQPRLALIFTCKGFAANSYQLAMDAVPRAENSVLRPRFDVQSSADTGKRDGSGAASGVDNPCYGPDTKVDLGLRFDWLAAAPFNGYAELEVVTSLGEPHVYQRVDLKDVRPATDAKGQPGTEIRVVFTPKFSQPGVSEVNARLVDGEGRLLWTDRYRMAWDWEHYQPKLLIPADFQAYWQDTLATLRATPLAAETTRVAAYEDHPKFEIYDVTWANWGGQRLHALLFVPKGAKLPLPAIITAHPGITGFGVTKRPDGVYGSELKQDPRFVTLVPLIRGHAPDAPDIPFNPPWWGPLDDRDTYVARAWYCAMARAVDYLATRPDLVDLSRVIASGGSQGGALALVTAALDPRVAYCVADCPACCQPQEILEHYPSFGPSQGQIPAGQTLAQVEQMLSYYNPVNFCPLIHCPTYVGSNIGDLTVHSMGPLAAYHSLTALSPAQKAFYPGFSHGHGSGPGLGLKRSELLDLLGGPLPK